MHLHDVPSCLNFNVSCDSEEKQVVRTIILQPQFHILYRIVDTAEAARMLNCTVQNINDKKIRNTLTPVKASPTYSLFLKGDVERC